MKKYFCLLGILIGLSAGTFVATAQAAVQFSELPPPVKSSMAKQREFVAKLVQRNFPKMRLTKSKSDFVILQSVIDKKLLRAEQTWELQALGVCLGDALTGYIPGLRWVLVTDEYGIDPTLRFRDSSVQINALTLISKRIERGEIADVANIADQTKAFLSEKAPSLR